MIASLNSYICLFFFVWSDEVILALSHTAWTSSWLVQAMICQLFGSKPFPGPGTLYCSFELDFAVFFHKTISEVKSCDFVCLVILIESVTHCFVVEVCVYTNITSCNSHGDGIPLGLCFIKILDKRLTVKCDQWKNSNQICQIFHYILTLFIVNVLITLFVWSWKYKTKLSD